jgi:hypothetical protein
MKKQLAILIYISNYNLFKFQFPLALAREKLKYISTIQLPPALGKKNIIIRRL